MSFENVKVYIMCPAYIATGGIELLHQLCYKLRLLGYDAYMKFVGAEPGRSTTLKQYERYNVPAAEEIIDEEGNIIVFPEIYISDAVKKTKAKRVLWWMSVDNAYADTIEEFNLAFVDPELIHLSQSKYSTDYLVSKGVVPERILWLSDYINSEYLHLREVPDCEKDDVILFNPKKGFEKTSKIIGVSTGHVKWVALSRLFPEKMRDVMQHAKIYIDFGNHPGRDRIPREAAMCGCIVLTNMKGAAKNPVDVMIDYKYKFDDTIEPVEIFDVIAESIDKYSEYKETFQDYRKRTANEFKSFETDIMSVFEKITGQAEQNVEASVLLKEALDFIYAGQYEKAYRELIKYRKQGFDESLEYVILETTVRIELGELYEAEYELRECLKDYSDNYELLLLLARTHASLCDKESLLSCLTECQEAVRYSKDTADEAIVFSEACAIIEKVKAMLSTLK